jgi:hypothetical protein
VCPNEPTEVDQDPGARAPVGMIPNRASDEPATYAPQSWRSAFISFREKTARRTRAGEDAASGTWKTIAAVALAGAIALLLAYAEVRVFQADSYKALYDGRWIAHHGIPHTNYLSAVTYGQRWVNEQWLGELVYYGAWLLGGYALVAILAAVSIGCAYMIFAALVRSRGVSAGWTVFFTVAALLGLVSWAFVRAQDLALPLFAALLVICVTDSDRDRPGARLLLLVPLVAVWANIHGSVLLGTELAGVYLLWRAVAMARRREWRYVAGCVGLACVVGLTPLATPYGLDIIHYYRQFVGNPAQRVAGAEGRSPSFPGGAFFAVYLPLLLVVFLSVRAVVYRRPAPVFLLLACTLTGISAAIRLGNMPWHAMVTALLVAEVSKSRLPVWRPRAATLRAAVASAVTVSLAVIAGLAFRSRAGYEEQTAIRVNNAAATVAASHPCWLILADNLSAAALQWHHPSLAGRIAYDARAELYSPSEMMRWAIFQSGSSNRWASTTYGFQLLVGNYNFRPALAQRLERLSGTTVLARDSQGIAVLHRVADGRSAPGCSQTEKLAQRR